MSEQLGLITEPVTLATGNTGKTFVATIVPVGPDGRILPIVTPENTVIASLDLLDLAGKPIPPEHYTVRRSPDGQFTVAELGIGIDEELFRYFATFRHAEAEEAIAVPESVGIDRARLDAAIDALREVGGEVLADTLNLWRQGADLARPDQAIAELADIFSTTGTYSRVAEFISGEEESTGRLFAPFAPFFRNGTLCGQCDSANSLFASFLRHIIPTADGRDLRIDVRNGYLTRWRWLEGQFRHRQVVISIGVQPPLVIDVTPSRRTPGEGFWANFLRWIFDRKAPDPPSVAEVNRASEARKDDASVLGKKERLRRETLENLRQARHALLEEDIFKDKWQRLHDDHILRQILQLITVIERDVDRPGAGAVNEASARLERWQTLMTNLTLERARRLQGMENPFFVRTLHRHLDQLIQTVDVYRKGMGLADLPACTKLEMAHREL